MSEWKGKIIGCDRCGRECRCKFLESKELDGGFSRVATFEDVENGWQYRHEIGWLCPECNTKYESTLKEFLKGAL